MQDFPEMVEEPDVIAVVAGERLKKIPGDLYIPPDALRVLLDSFTGPLDLLLYLIRRQNLDILNIPITLITKQYMQYIEAAENSRLALAADYLVMAAWLAEIKSKILLPSANDIEEEEEDPRLALAKQLEQYERFKLAAEHLDTLPRQERDVFPVEIKNDPLPQVKNFPEVELHTLAEAFSKLMIKQTHFEHHHVARETLSVRERMNQILAMIEKKSVTEFSELYSFNEGRMGVVVSLLAILELSKQFLVNIIQMDAFSPIHLKALS